MIWGNDSMVKIPMSNTHCIQLEAKFTTGTSDERMFRGA